MPDNYRIEEIEIENLCVNPDNARYINSDELLDETAALKELIRLNQSDMTKLAEDISKNGLNPNELPVVIPDPDNDNKYLVMDGNRRIACIKLMTQYRNRLKELGLSAPSRRFLQKLQCNIETVNCVVYEKDDHEVNDLLEKLHTSRPGISQKKWDPQAQDRHRLKNGALTRRLAIIELLRVSKYTTPEVRNILNKGGWVSKLQRFAEHETNFFGMDFDEDNNIILYLEESEIVKALCQLVTDLFEKKANEIAQTVDVRKSYLKNFPSDKIPNFEKIANPPIIFMVDSKTFVVSDLELGVPQKNAENENKKDFQRKESVASKTSFDEKNSSTSSKGKSVITNGRTDDDFIERKGGIASTQERTTLIPKDENIPISDQRTKDLYNELKLLPVNKYVNVTSISLRSLVEFSINIFLEKKGSNLAFNQQVSLFDKLDKVIRILESGHTKTKLEREIPAIYKSIVTYKENKLSDLNSIPLLHLLIHSHTYHPTERELKSLYNNYSRLLNIIWNEI